MKDPIEGLTMVLDEAKSQFGWFDDQIENNLCAVIDKAYYRGSRDSYGYMINAVEEAINSQNGKP